MHGSKKKAPRGAFKKRRLRKLRLTDHDQPRLPPFWRSCLGLNPARMAGLILLGRTSTCQPLFLANLRISFPAPRVARHAREEPGKADPRAPGAVSGRLGARPILGEIAERQPVSGLPAWISVGSRARPRESQCQMLAGGKVQTTNQIFCGDLVALYKIFSR